MYGASVIKAQRLIATLMAASTPIERYLKQGSPLTPLQLQSIALTVSMLQTFLKIWTRRHAPDTEITVDKVSVSGFMKAATHRAIAAKWNQRNRNSAAVVLGRLGGLKGGKARAAKLSPRKRASIAKLAAVARWAKRSRQKSTTGASD